MSEAFANPGAVDTCTQATSEADARCAWCQTTIEDPEHAPIVPCVRNGPHGLYVEEQPWHQECRTRFNVGSLAHLEGRCRCCHGEPDRAPSTPQEIRAEAIAVWRRVTSET